ncbi:hypothetical protein NYQ10_10855 [Flavobacterium johnsoniae]|uniref:hypothetical protein n=1 Tax=Flavobacterium johnsoniae TaxID=986 RepID=UPI0025AED6F4|nr:hypothetical protein [Flavobacterium johnsoniae]WJS96932.1 hypothetical protein NYQ10_10855 [Flavobacterium johnsoniae]
MTNNWTDIKWIFEPEGSLRDIYIKNTSIDDWKILINYLNSSQIVKYGLTGENQIINPIDLEYVIEYLHDETGLMETKCASIIIDNIIINQHFFSINEIEFDIDPREITSFEDYKEILNFMNEISRILQKSVILTGENQMDFPLIEVDFSKNLIKALTQKEAEKLWK